MNTSLVNFVGSITCPCTSLPGHLWSPRPLSLLLCAQRKPHSEDVSIKMSAVHQPLNTHFQSASQASGFLPSHSGSCCPMSLFIHCLLLKVYTPETKRRRKNEPKAGPGTRREGI